MATPAIPAVPYPGPSVPEKAMLLLICDYVRDMLIGGSFSQAVDHITSTVRPPLSANNIAAGYSLFVVPASETEEVTARSVVTMSYTANVVVMFKGTSQANAEAFLLFVQDIKDYLRFRPIDDLTDANGKQICSFAGITQDPYFADDAMDQSGLMVSALAVTYKALRH